MLTIILPGYSLHNKDWAEEVKQNLESGIEVIVHEWKHWSSGSFSLNYETDKIEKEFEKEKTVNILAKSVGTRVCAELLRLIPEKIGKIILCGIPLRGMHDESKNYFKEAIKNIQPENIICFQNKFDPFGTYRLVEKFIREINPKIKVEEKDASDHNYPYFEDFKKFLEI